MSKKVTSCDTFVALPPATENGCVVFGKNSDRPHGEVQEVIYLPAAEHSEGSKLRCTYIEIDQVPHTHATTLSRPAWLWGAEMGANEHGVCIGNEAVYTKEPCSCDDGLLGMDYVRLGLERGKTAKEAVHAMTSVLEQHGQGGACAEDEAWSYHNSYIVADRTEAWVLETAGNWWAAERVDSGVRNISNELTIGSKIDAMAEGLKEHAKAKGYWNGDGDFHFSKTFSSMGSEPGARQVAGKWLLTKKSMSGEFNSKDMMDILRDERSGICMVGAFTSVGSQVSVLPPPDATAPPCHWFTGTPNPALSIYKPFIFTPNVKMTESTKSPDYGSEDPLLTTPRFHTQVDREHPLWNAHEHAYAALSKRDRVLLTTMRELETKCVNETNAFVKGVSRSRLQEADDLFKKHVDAEMSFYK